MIPTKNTFYPALLILYMPYIIYWLPKGIHGYPTCTFCCCCISILEDLNFFKLWCGGVPTSAVILEFLRFFTLIISVYTSIFPFPATTTTLYISVFLPPVPVSLYYTSNILFLFLFILWDHLVPTSLSYLSPSCCILCSLVHIYYCPFGNPLW